jgi:hypothetical protein
MVGWLKLNTVPSSSCLGGTSSCWPEVKVWKHHGSVLQYSGELGREELDHGEVEQRRAAAGEVLGRAVVGKVLRLEPTTSTCGRSFLGHLWERDWAGGVAQLADGWWTWPCSCCCCATPSALMFGPPWHPNQELRGMRAPLPRPGWRSKAAYAVTCPHRGGSATWR